MTTMRKPKGNWASEPHRYNLDFQLCFIIIGESEFQAQRERESKKVTQRSHHLKLNFCLVNPAYYMPLDILLNFTEIKARAKTGETTMDPEANGKKYKQAKSMYIPAILKQGKLLIVK